MGATKVETRDDKTLAEQAYRMLEEMIVTLEYPPGAVLSEARMSAETGFGRTPVREALQRLAGESLVAIVPRRGITVSDINLREQLLLLETRRELERLIAQRSARRSSTNEREIFEAMAQAMIVAANAEDSKAFLRIDREFNVLNAQAARNPFALRSIGPLHALSRRFWVFHYQADIDVPRSADLHAAVMNAIARGSESAAARASDELMDYIEDFTRATVQERF